MCIQYDIFYSFINKNIHSAIVFYFNLLVQFPIRVCLIRCTDHFCDIVVDRDDNKQIIF
jgi:hypothetical protein